MKQILFASGPVVADADLDFFDLVLSRERDLPPESTSDVSVYQAWEFDADDTAMVDEFSY